MQHPTFFIHIGALPNSGLWIVPTYYIGFALPCGKFLCHIRDLSGIGFKFLKLTIKKWTAISNTVGTL